MQILLGARGNVHFSYQSTPHLPSREPVVPVVTPILARTCIAGDRHIDGFELAHEWKQGMAKIIRLTCDNKDVSVF